MSPSPQASPFRPRGARAVLTLVALFACLLSGCSSEQSKKASLVESFANISVSKATESQQLRNLLATLEQEGALPAQLKRKAIPDKQNAAVLLAKTLDPPLRTALHGPLKAFLAREQFDYDEEQLRDIVWLMQRHTSRRTRFHAASDRPTAQFPIGTHIGFFASTSYLEDVAIACRFDLIAVAVELSNNRVEEATDLLERAARWIGWLAREPRIEPRMLAAELRREWLMGVAGVARHPSSTMGDYERLRGVLVSWLTAWPDEAAAIAGDRAAVLHAYETIRAGLINDVATGSDERIRLSERGITAEKPASPEQIDEDMRQYLRTVATVIASLRRPYYQRADKQASVAVLLEDTATAPFAAEMFLPGLPTMLEGMSIDRAACETWAIALSSASGFRLPDYRTNPHNGQPYQIDRLPRSIAVKSDDLAIADAFVLVRRK